MPDEWLEKMRSISGIVKGGTPRFGKVTHKDMTERYRDHNNPLAEITKDKVMFKTIMEGNASDKVFKKEVEAIERARVTEKKENPDLPKSRGLKGLKKTTKRSTVLMRLFSALIFVAFCFVLGLYLAELRNVKIACPSTQVMYGGECFTPYVEYCDSRKIDVRTGKPTEGF